MAKATKQLGGGAKDKYFRELFAAAPGLDASMARKLAELTRSEVSQVRIRQPLGDRSRLLGESVQAKPGKEDGAKPGKEVQAKPGKEVQAKPGDEDGAKPGDEDGATPGAKSATAQPAAPAPAVAAPTTPEARPATATASPAAAFDPFAFTAVVVLKRQGAEALSKRLAEIDEPAHLRLLADKQHLGVPPDAHDAATLRAAILKSAQARIDDRRAAAS